MIKTKKCETVKQKGTIIYTEVLSLAIDVEAAVKKKCMKTMKCGIMSNKEWPIKSLVCEGFVLLDQKTPSNSCVPVAFAIKFGKLKKL